jgi:hypothetical protein
MLFLNTTGAIGQIITGGTTNITGTVVGTLIFILIFLMAICILFGIPLEFSSVLVFPYILAVGAFYGQFMLPLVLLTIFLTIIIGKNFMFR